MIKITYAKTNNDGSITIKAQYRDTVMDEAQRGICKYFITKAPISVDPYSVDHADITLVAYYQSCTPCNSLDVTIGSQNIIADTLNDVLFVYVVTNDNDLMLCECKDRYDMTSVFPLCKIYSMFMGFIGSLNHEECNIPMNFIDQIMRYVYLMSAHGSGNHYRVKEIWDQYFKNASTANNSQPNCGCNG